MVEGVCRIIIYDDVFFMMWGVGIIGVVGFDK